VTGLQAQRLKQAFTAPLEAIALAGAWSFALVYAMSSLWMPYFWDHGILAAVGDAIARGGLPYRDAWDLKGPFAFVPFALSQLVFGKVMWGIRVVELLILAPALYAVFRAVAARTTPYLGAWTSLLLYLWFASGSWIFTAQPDLWVAAACALALCPFLKSGAGASARTFFSAGALIGCAGLVKPSYLAFGLVPLATLAALAGISVAQRIRFAAWLALGPALLVILVLAYLTVRGGLHDAIEVHLLYTSRVYLKMLSGSNGLVNGVSAFFLQWPVLLLLPFAALGLWAHRGDRPLFVALVAWLGVAVALVFLQWKFYIYHWYIIYPPYVMAAALGIWALSAAAPKLSHERIVALGTGLLCLAYVAASPAHNVVRWTMYVAGIDSADTFYGRYQFYAYHVRDEVAAAAYIAAHTTPDQGLFVWGNDATVSYLSGRPNPTRFTFDLPLSLDSPYRPQYRAEAMRALSENPPAYVVVGLPWSGNKAKTLPEFPEFVALLNERYVLDRSFGILDVYRHK